MGAVAKQRARDLERRNERCHLGTDRLDSVNVDGSGVEDERIVSDATALLVEWLGNPDDGLGNHLVVEGGDCFRTDSHVSDASRSEQWTISHAIVQTSTFVWSSYLYSSHVQRGLGFLHFLVNVREGRKDR